MRFFKDKNYRKIAIVISIPVLLIAQYYLFKIGIFKPMVKGVEVSMVEGDVIKDLDKFIIKLDEEVTLSSGDYITIPSYSKEPVIWFQELDEGGILKIEGNKIIGLKEGISSVGIMKDSRVLKKINIKVVQQKVKDLKATPNEDIKYVGESTEIETVVEVDYDRFKEKAEVKYSSTDESILQVVGNKVNAVGVGKASILVKSGDLEQELSYNIKAKIDKIKIDKVIELGVGKVKKLKPEIITSPKGLKYGNVEYELVDNKLPIERAIALDVKDGTIQGLQEGEERVKISCGGKSTIVTVKVIKDNTENNDKVQNLEVDYEVVDNKIIISLVWDYLKDINKYGVYIKNNSLQDKEYKLFNTINLKPEEISESNKVKATIELDLVDGKIPDLSMYVVGITDVGNTQPSNIVNIKPTQEEEDIEKETVENLNYSIDEENETIKLTWEPLNIPNVTYSIFIKNNLNGESGFALYQNGVQGTECTIPITTDNLDLEVYVVGYQNDKQSIPSNTVSIKK
ncbi:MAG: hypothetical protein ACRC92_06090 [Peptostreptococcaceae bacterium]